MKHIGIIGAGAWGTALALVAMRAQNRATLWSISADEVEVINFRHENVYRLPGIALDPELNATTDPQDLSEVDAIILAVPAQFMRATCETFCEFIPASVPLIIASKGIETETSLLMSEVIQKSFPKNPLLSLSGPSFATEVACKLPTSVALASESFSLSKKISELLVSPSFHLIPCVDLIGVQVGGACKNIIAIACGILEGKEMGDNARAALVTRGLDEVARLGCAMGAKQETFLGLAGAGDMILTSLSHQSRNHTFGVSLGKGTPLNELLSHKSNLTEGVHSVSGAVALAERFGVHMPITFAMNTFLNGKGFTMENLLDALVTYPLQAEAA